MATKTHKPGDSARKRTARVKALAPGSNVDTAPAEETLAEWGARWLAAWCDEAHPNDRDSRRFVAENWRNATIDTVMHWWQMDRQMHGGKTREQFHADHAAYNHLTLYQSERIGLSVWRAYREYRDEGLPIPEHILRKFDQWAERLETANSPMEAAQALEMGARGYGGSAPRHLMKLERTRAIVTEVHRLMNHQNRRRSGVDRLTDSSIYQRVAAEYHLKPDAVKKMWQRWHVRQMPHGRPVSSVFDLGRKPKR